MASLYRVVDMQGVRRKENVLSVESNIRDAWMEDIRMEEIRIEDVVLKYNFAEKFTKIKEHMEACAEGEMTNESVAMHLMHIAINNYKFL